MTRMRSRSGAVGQPSDRPLEVPFHAQADDGFCLPACVQMVLEHLGVRESQQSLARKLDVRSPLGAPASNVMHLRSDILEATCSTGTLGDLRQCVARGYAPIAFLQAGELPHWRGRRSQHAVVVVGVAEASVCLLDPAADESTIRVPAGDFLLAWIEMDCLYALITRSQSR